MIGRNYMKLGLKAIRDVSPDVSSDVFHEAPNVSHLPMWRNPEGSAKKVGMKQSSS